MKKVAYNVCRTSFDLIIDGQEQFGIHHFEVINVGSLNGARFIDIPGRQRDYKPLQRYLITVEEV